MSVIRLALFDGANRAGTSAAAAAYASVSGDNVLAVALSDSTTGALTGAGAAAYASVRNSICHDVLLILRALHIVLQDTHAGTEGMGLGRLRNASCVFILA